jgi:hypothetical protein
MCKECRTLNRVYPAKLIKIAVAIRRAKANIDITANNIEHTHMKRTDVPDWVKRSIITTTNEWCTKGTGKGAGDGRDGWVGFVLFEKCASLI